MAEELPERNIHMAKKQKKIINVSADNNLLNIDYIPVEDPYEIRAMERGENGWMEASVAARGLVPCTSRIKGTVYRIRLYGSQLDKEYPMTLVRHLLGGKTGRVFMDAEGKIRIVINLTKKQFEALLAIVAMDAYKRAGFTI